jgi:hypothetical protein
MNCARQCHRLLQQQWRHPKNCPLLRRWMCDLIREIGSSSGSKSEGLMAEDGVAREAIMKVQKVGVIVFSGVAKVDGT